MGKRGIALFVVAAALFGSFGVAHADEAPPVCGEPTDEYIVDRRIDTEG